MFYFENKNKYMIQQLKELRKDLEYSISEGDRVLEGFVLNRLDTIIHKLVKDEGISKLNLENFPISNVRDAKIFTITKSYLGASPHDRYEPDETVVTVEIDTKNKLPNRFFEALQDLVFTYCE